MEEPKVELPELPKGRYDFWDDYYEGLMMVPEPDDRYRQVGLFDEDQMRDYARAAVLAERERVAHHLEQIANVISGPQESDGQWKLLTDLAASIRKG